MPPSLIAFEADAACGLAVVVPADVVERVNAFVGADSDIGCGGDLCHARELIRRDRLLEEIEARPLHGAHVSESLLDAVALVGVGRDEHAISEHLADLARPRGVILRRVDADLDLVGGHAGGLLLSASRRSPSKSPPPITPSSGMRLRFLSPSSACTGFARRAAGEIVQRNFDRGLGAVVAIHAAVHRGERAGDVGGIATAQTRQLR